MGFKLVRCSCVQMAGAATAKGGGGNGTTCTATLALISDTLSTPSVTASGQLAFYFSSPAAGTAATAFQCRLSDAAGSTSGGQLHDWRACTSPDTYSGVPDGNYAYQVCCAAFIDMFPVVTLELQCQELYCR